MRRTILLLAGVMLCVVALGSDSPKEYDDKTEYVGIEGTWRLIEIETNGNKTPITHYWMGTYRRGIYTTKFDDGHTNGGNYRIDSACNLDLMPSSGVLPLRCLYRIDGDTLRIALFIPKCDQRPQGFNDKSVFVETYKRVK